MSYEAVIGLEVHVQLKTRTKLFCRCSGLFGGEPNAHVCAVCLGYPGTLPVLNRHAVDQAIRLGLALGCDIRYDSVFARKNYFYPDSPKGYQISQFDRPIAEHGRLPLTQHEGAVEIERMHMEEDAGKLLHEAPGGGALPGSSLVDFNRCGVPLVEIVTDPVLRSASQAQDYLQTLHQVLLYTDTSDGNMEEGSLRCDANVSIRPRGQEELGTKVEVKNMNSFRNVARAIEYEIERQSVLLDAGEEIAQETRSFDAGSGKTRTLRGKEEAHDYRYFPDPDLPILKLDPERVQQHEEGLPELPWHRRTRFVEDYGLTVEAAAQLSATRGMADYFEECAGAHPADVRSVANWIQGEVQRELKERQEEVDQAMAPARLAALLDMVQDGALSLSAAKEVFAEIWEGTESPEAAAERLGLLQVRDEGQLDAWVQEALAENPEPFAQLKDGEHKVLGFLVGQVMKKSQGSAEPKRVRELIAEHAGAS
ncbi:MAG: Asp-tRNA(Asn)/Glu-tRNA(Gln) amidotransferase subunit GatB [Acidobacteriota bacterium]